VTTRAWLLLPASLLALAGCGAGATDPADTAIDPGDGVILPPEDTLACDDDVTLPPDGSWACTVDAECVARLGPAPACQVARCLAGGVCAFEPAPNGTPCDDGDACTLGDQCQDGACQPGATPLLCEDGNPCTDGVCEPAVGCLFVPNEEPCDDGNPCTEGERCEGGVCTGGEVICECAVASDCPAPVDLCLGPLACNDAGACVVDPAAAVVCPAPSHDCERVRCEPSTGACVTEPAPDGIPCDDGDPCTAGSRCEASACVPGAVDLCPCPDGMVKIDGAWCIDRYEASRPDATASTFGQDTSRATSRPGVLPWFPVDRPIALAACGSAGKRLCTAVELEQVCRGPAGTAYAYGATYEPSTCNGIDTFCYCDAPACAALSPCPYPRCYDRTPEGLPGGCGAAFGVRPTGSFPGCVNAHGVYDLNGNVWELVDTGTEASWFKGGAYNCLDSRTLHRCDGLYQNVTARGFRCCAEPAAPPPPP